MGSLLKTFVFGKYKGILVSVALFILLDASVLMLNFFISFQIADDAVGVNLAGRQRMLTQRMAKGLYSMESEFQSQEGFKDQSIDELKLASGLFDRTFYAFLNGGVVKGADGSLVSLAEITNPSVRQSLIDAEQRWVPYKKAVQALLNARDQELPRQEIASLLEESLTLARVHNLPLLKLMNDFTVSLENVATSKANRLRWIQTVGISLAVMNFLFILFHFIRQLRDSDAVLEEARNETVEILNTVSEGLFLVDKDLIIGTQYSKNLEEILGRKEVAGISLSEILGEMVNQKEAKTTADFIGLLFSPKVKEKLIGDLNPLNEIEVNLYRGKAVPETRYLSFNFSRALNDGEILHVLVTVTDITEHVLLGRELNAVKEQTDKQVEMLTGLLHANPSLLKEFIANAYRAYSRINGVLKLPGKTDNVMKSKLSDIYVEVHNFKGEAASLKLESFAERAHAFEDEITTMSHKLDLSGNDFLALTVYLDELIAYTQQVESLAGKMAAYGSAQAVDKPTPIDAWKPLDEIAQQIAERQGKNVQLVTSGLGELQVSTDFARELRVALIQLIRNGVSHGVEDPSARRAAEKSEQGRIDIRVSRLDARKLEVVVRDDGAGFNYEALRNLAFETGRWQPEEIESWDHKKLVSLIFQPELSTADAVSEDSGRGVGMSAVLAWVNRYRGKINVASRPGSYTRFIISIEVPEADMLAA